MLIISGQPQAKLFQRITVLRNLGNTGAVLPRDDPYTGPINSNAIANSVSAHRRMARWPVLHLVMMEWAYAKVYTSEIPLVPFTHRGD